MRLAKLLANLPVEMPQVNTASDTLPSDALSDGGVISSIHPTTDSEAQWADLADWVAMLSLQNFSAHTIDAYEASVIRLFHFMDADNKLKGSIYGCTRHDLQRFFGTRLEESQIKAISAKQDLSAIRKFFDYLIDTGKISNNPTTGYQLKSEPRALPTIADEELMRRLLEQPTPEDASKARLWLRDKAMFELMYSSGLRVSELVGLDVTDINLHEKTVRVLGKGKKYRQAPIGSQAIAAITAYLPVRAAWQKETTAALFISERLGTRLTTRAVQLRLKACAKSAGIAENLHPHLLRHCFASHMLSASGDLRAVQEMLGHSNISTTQIYTQVDFGTLAKVYDHAHPRASITKKR